VTSPRGIPTSRAYWELKAEQMLNRVFSSEAPIVVEVVEPNATPAAAAPTGHTRHLPIWVTAAACATALATAAAAMLWSGQQQALRQERNLMLLERIRSLGPATAKAQPQADPDEHLPPPPQEPWMEELAQLPAAGAPQATVLKVPFTPTIGAGAPTAPPPLPSESGTNLPLLVGVVQSQGRSASAIFQIGGSSTSAAVGESIAGSGWRLRSASGDTAVIERAGQQRRLSISGGF
jgi:hypothetical protein